MKKVLVTLLSICMVILVAGCGNVVQSDNTKEDNSSSVSGSINSNVSSEETGSTLEEKKDLGRVTELLVIFGYNGTPFTLHLYDNVTAAEIADYVGTTSWNLPIYHFDDYENYEVMQYYDVSSRYKFTSNPETITEVKAGEVYYSDPNRIVLFYQDAVISGEYTRIGYIDYSEDFYNAVVNNPVLEGWGNKIVSITPVD